MATQASLDQVQYVYIAFYGRPADAAGQEYWADQLDAANGDLSAIIDEFASSAEYDSQYGDLSNEELVQALYQQILGREADEDGLAYYVGELESGARTRGAIALDILSGPLNNPEEADPTDLAVLTNRKEVADAFTAAVESSDKEYGEEQLSAAKALLAGVDADTNPDTVDVFAVVSDFPDAGEGPTEPVEGETQYLAVDQDILTGTEGDDTFNARVAQNMLGAQVNTLGSGDVIDGGEGNDTLMAKVTAGLYGFNSDDTSSAPINPETTSVETILIEAAETDLHGAGQNTQVVINAKDLHGVDEIGSYRSDADLLVQNMTTKDNDGNMTNLSDMTVSMAYTGNADSQWGESDLTVYFDQDYLVPEGTRTNPIVDFLAMNEDNYDATNGERPLDGVFFRELNFRLNGEEFDLTEYLGEDAEGTGSEITTYAEFLEAVQEALIQLKAAHPENDALQSVTAQFGRDFTTDVNPDTLELREGVAIRLTVDGLTNGVENDLSVEATDLEVARAAGADVPNNNRYEIADDEPPVEGERLSINVDLEKVGLAGDGGALVIGSMNKDNSNTWGAVNTVVDGTTSGIEEFNVTVYGNDTKSSSLSGLHSTNNNLRVVTVATDENQTGSYANLTIGNSNSQSAGVKDVQTFDASAFKGDLSLTAELSDEITAKYMDLRDENPDAPAADNVEFQYTGGEGNDSFVLAIDSANLTDAGTTTREDFELTVDGGEGDDYIALGIFDETGNPAINGLASDTSGLANWYDNSNLNANLTLNGGAGNDTIWTPGAGNVVINGGTGNDTVYADNTGEVANWVFNTTDNPDQVAATDFDDLESDTNDSYQLYRASLTVDFKGFEVTVDLQDEDGVVTDLEINQAIKEAINSDDVLNKLLEAEDGPANTLVVTSLIDGEMDLSDLTVSLSAPESLTAGEVQQISNLWGLTGQTDASLITLMEGVITGFETKGDYASTFGDNDGTDSSFTSDNIITGGTGDDVLVLGTGALSNDTVVYEGLGNGTDTIVNFNTDTAATTVTTPVAAAPESFTVTFADLVITDDTAATTITFDGASVNLDNGLISSSLIPAADVAYAFANDYANAGWTVTYVPGTSEVIFEATANGDIDPDFTAADFVFTNTGAADGGVVVSDYVDGQDAYQAAVAQEFTVDFGGTIATADGTLDLSTLDGLAATTGTQVAYTDGDGPITLAANVAAGSYANWTAVDNLDGTVTFTANATGPVDAAIDTAAELDTEFDNGTNGIAAASVIDVTGADQTGDATTTTSEAAPALDYLDFSDYNATAVYVDGVLVAGTAPNEESDLYVTLTENTDNAGEYTMRVVDSGVDGLADTTSGGTAANDDAIVGVIGVADFGETQPFVADNFIL